MYCQMQSAAASNDTRARCAHLIVLEIARSLDIRASAIGHMTAKKLIVTRRLSGVLPFRRLRPASSFSRPRSVALAVLASVVILFSIRQLLLMRDIEYCAYCVVLFIERLHGDFAEEQTADIV